MKRTAIICLLLGIVNSLFARQRTESEIFSVAQAVLLPQAEARSRAFDKSTPIHVLRREQALTVVGASDAGFAIVANDDRHAALIGYSSTPYGDERPCCFDHYLQAVNQALQSSSFTLEDEDEPSESLPIRPYVDPLIHTHWDQQAPYNQLCPVFGSRRTLTGCVATAFAQLMKFYEFPSVGHGTHSYTFNAASYGSQQLELDFSTMPFAWSLMPNETSEYTSPEQIKAVAALHYAVGVAANMNYGLSESGASDYVAAKALRDYFDYSSEFSYLNYNSTDELSVGYFGQEDWLDPLYEELSKGYPVVYAGQGPTGGHAFLADGYNEQGLLHINWGWGGSYDGYFRFGALRPGSRSYNQHNSYIIGLRPVGMEDPLTEIELTSPGSLSQLLPEAQNKTLRKLKVSGPINEDDISYLRVLSSQRALIAIDMEEASLTDNKLPNRAFYNCSNLRSVRIPQGVTSIGDLAFAVCGSLVSVEIPDEVTSIGSQAFWSCYNLTSVQFGSKVKQLGTQAFSYTGLTEVNLPASCTDVGWYTFLGNEDMTDIHVDEANTAYRSFDGVLYNKGLSLLICYPMGKQDEEFTPPSAVTTIQPYAFYKNAALRHFQANNGLRSIASRAFGGAHVTHVSLPASCSSLALNAFAGCLELEAVDVNSRSLSYSSANGVLYNQAKTELLLYPAGKKEPLFALPQSVQAIGAGAFTGNVSLTEIELPATLTSIGSEAFSGCTGLQRIVAPFTTPPAFSYDAFPDEVYSQADVLIPLGTFDTFVHTAGWNLFEHLVESDLTGITNIDAAPGEAPLILNLQGQRAQKSEKGIVIVRSRDGQTRKILKR